MRRIHGFTLTLGVLAAGAALAQSSGGQFGITHSVIAPAQTVSGGSFSLSGTAGQAETSATGAGSFQLVGGFAAANTVTDHIFANGFEP